MSLPSVLVLVSPGFDNWLKAGSVKRYFNVMLTVCVTDGISAIRKATAEYARKQMYFNAVCLASSHGHEREPKLRWKNDGHLSLTQSAVKVVAQITKRVHIITCWQGLFLQAIDVPGVVLSGYNTWMNAYGEDETGHSVEPEPWQLQYVCCGLPIDDAVEHYDATGKSCQGKCRAEPGKLVIKCFDDKLK
jgi:hypothetical protein